MNKTWPNSSILIISLCASGLFHSMLTCDQWCSHYWSICLVLPHQLSVISLQGVQIGVNPSYKQQTAFIQLWRWPNWRACLKTPHEWAIILTKSQNLSLTWTNVDMFIRSDKRRREQFTLPCFKTIITKKKKTDRLTKLTSSGLCFVLLFF